MPRTPWLAAVHSKPKFIYPDADTCKAANYIYSSHIRVWPSDQASGIICSMPMKNVREDSSDSQISGFSEFSKPQLSAKLLNPNVLNSGFEGKNMFDSSDSKSFYERLSKLNESLGYNLVFDVRSTRLNLHIFYKEVTLRGGFNQVNKDRRWDEIASSLKLDGRNLNYSDILLKLYALFLYHYEQIYFYRGPEKVASAPDATIDIEDSPLMEKKCTNHSSQVVTNVKDGPGKKKVFKKSCSQSMLTGEAEQKKIPQLHLDKEEIWTKGPASTESEPAAPEAAPEQIPQLHSKKKEKKKKKGSASAQKQLTVPKKKGMKKKPGARQGLRSGYHIFIKTECDRLKNIESNKGQNLRHMANDAWNRLSEAEKQPFIEQSIKEKAAKKLAVDDEQNHVMESADLENEQSLPDSDNHMILDPSDAEKSTEVD